MADRPLTESLPADLPEDWTSGQIVAPAGAEVGLSEQHGYNYLMASVNKAQRAVNAINESFDDVSGKRTCRVVVGTSTAGWTQADCDYLCDGTDDQEELNEAVEAIRAKGGGRIAILAGEYQLSEAWNVDGSNEKDMALAFSGESGATVLNLSADSSVNPSGQKRITTQFSGITFCGGEIIRSIKTSGAYASFENCIFLNTVVFAMNSTNGSLRFRGNTVEITGTTNNNTYFLVFSGEKESDLIDGNTFLVKSYPGVNKIIQIQAGGAIGDAGPIFINNVIENDVADKYMVVEMQGCACVGSNYVVGASILVDNSAICMGNRVKNGGIRADHDAVIAGNEVQNGNIYTSGYTTVIGNIVAAPSEGNAMDTVAIGVQKYGGNNIPEQYTPSITGNVIMSGKIGIHLQVENNPLVNQNMKKVLISCNRISGCATSIKIESNWSGCLVTGNMLDSSVVDNGTGNIVRLNSNDAGGGGGGTAGVSSFNGRAGAVVPQNGDYTATMVGAIPTDSVEAIQAVTQAEYDAISVKSPTTLYLIKE